MTQTHIITQALVAFPQPLSLVVWLLLVLAPAPASAVMPPWVYAEAREGAMFHVQVKILKVTESTQNPGSCTVTGEAVRIFRDKPGALQMGAVIEFAVACSKPGDPIIVGGTLWTDHDRLVRAQYLEVFLDHTERGYEVALWQSYIIEAPTAQPTVP